MDKVSLKAELKADQKLVIKYRNQNLLTLNMSLYDKLFGSGDSLAVNFLRDYSDSEIKRASQLSRLYAKRKWSYLGRPVKDAKIITRNELAFRHFLGAVRIMKKYNIKSGDRYLKMQVEGLKFTRNFPEPNQLATAGAETRVLAYQRKNNPEKYAPKAKIPKLKIPEKDKKTNLKNNTRYMESLQLIKEGAATLEEAAYVKQLQELRMGKAKDYVLQYIDKLVVG